jgi:hypothetical protein
MLSGILNVGVRFLPCFLPLVIFGLCLTILLHLPASVNLDSILPAYKCDHGFMSFNVIEELQEEDGKSPLSISECHQYNHKAQQEEGFYSLVYHYCQYRQCSVPIWTKLSVQLV